MTVESNAGAEARLEACRRTRLIASDAFAEGLQELLSSGAPISELDLANRWLARMRRSPRIHREGWYKPPEHGIGVLIGTQDNPDRINYTSLRPPGNWPDGTVFLDREKGIMYVYASPVDKETGMIGDWGMTIYFGDDPEIKDHLKLCLQLNHQVLQHAQIGMTFGELTRYADKQFRNLRLANEVTSTTDKKGVNIGHTVPASNDGWSQAEWHTFERGNWEEILKMISMRRVFLNTDGEMKIVAGMAFTIEQRLTRPGQRRIPMCSYHTIALVHTDGRMELLTGFDEVFRIAGMDYMLER